MTNETGPTETKPPLENAKANSQVEKLQLFEAQATEPPPGV